MRKKVSKSYLPSPILNRRNYYQPDRPILQRSAVPVILNFLRKHLILVSKREELSSWRCEALCDVIEKKPKRKTSRTEKGTSSSLLRWIAPLLVIFNSAGREQSTSVDCWRYCKWFADWSRVCVTTEDFYLTRKLAKALVPPR